MTATVKSDIDTAGRTIAAMQQMLGDALAQHQALMSDLLKERRKERRHKNVRLGIIFSGVLFALGAYLYLLEVIGGRAVGTISSGSYAAIVQVKGEIADGKSANAIAINKALTRAFNDPGASGVVLYINSPGGSPVQSAIIHDRIMALKADHPGKPILAVATDIVTSGAYLVASAADRIYVNRSTITGSIGVMSAGFGFAGALKRFGIERRVFAAGKTKAQLDPFTPLSDVDTEKIRRILSKIHEHFIESVMDGRGDRLALNTADLFEGDVWTGAEALEIGLVDGFGELTSVLQQELGVDGTRDYTVKPHIFERLTRFAANTAVEAVVGHHNFEIR